MFTPMQFRNYILLLVLIFSFPITVINGEFIDDSSRAVRYSKSPSWYSHKSLPAVFWKDGTATSSGQIYSYVTYTHENCNRIKWYATLSYDRGMADVYIDGIFQRTVDQYSAFFIPSIPVFDSGLLSPGKHTITIILNGKKFLFSFNNYVEIDSFEVTPLPPISKNNSIYVSPSGNDSNAGTINLPVKSIQRGLNIALDKIKNPNTSGAIEVILKPGIHSIERPLEIDPQFSQNPNTSLVIKSVPEKAAAISGALIQKGSECQWTPFWTNNVLAFQCKLTQQEKFRQLINAIKSTSNYGSFAISDVFIQKQGPSPTVETIRGIRSRYPDADGTVNLANIDKSNPQGRVYVTKTFTDWQNITDPSLKVDINKGIVEIVFTKLWQSYRAPLSDIHYDPPTPSGQGVTMFSSAFETYMFGGGAVVPFSGQAEKGHLENSKSFLSMPGEWFLDEKDLVFYYVPRPSENLYNSTFYFPVTSTLFNFKGQQNANVKNITIQGVRLQFTGWKYQNQAGTSNVYGFNQAGCGLGGVIEGNYLNNITIKNNIFQFYGMYGISLGGGHKGYWFCKGDSSDPGSITNVTINNNRFQDGGGGAIRVNVHSTTQDGKVITAPGSSVTIFSNLIVDVGKIFWDTIGILVLTIESAQIYSNFITNLPYSGIHAGHGCPNKNDSFFIAFNTVDNVMRKLVDGGGIYTNGGSGVIKANIVKNVGTTRYADASFSNHTNPDIYMDDTSTYWEILQNQAKTLMCKSTSIIIDPNQKLSVTPALTYAVQGSTGPEDASRICPGATPPQNFNPNSGFACRK